MANIWRDAVLTRKGTALLAKLTSGQSLTITKAVAGSGSVPAVGLAQQTDVSIPKQTLQFSAITYPEHGKVKIPAILKNDEVTEAYTARQIGLFAEDPDEEEILFLILQADQYSEVPGIAIPTAQEQPGFSAEWDMVFQYGQAQDVTVVVDPANTVSQETMEHYVDSCMLNIKVDVQQAATEIVEAGLLTHSLDGSAHGDLFEQKADKTFSNVAANDLVSKLVAADLEGPPVTAHSTDGVIYEATVSGLTALKNGLKITIIPNMGSTIVLPKLNVNGLGAKNIKQRLSVNTTTAAQAKDSTWMTINKPVPLLYDGMQWVTITPRPSANDMYGEIAIVNGGTGADNAAQARINLGISALLETKLEAHLLSSVEYDNLPEEEKSEHVLYLLTDDPTEEQVEAHLLNQNNPHSVSKEQLGLGQVDNTSDVDKPVSTAVLAALSGKAAIESFSLTLLSTEWSSTAPYRQTVTVPELQCSSYVLFEIAETASDEQYLEAFETKLRRIKQAENTIAFKAYGSKPSIDIPITLYAIW